ncbi:MAG TPA: glycerophosphodiester phosphodiesterase [Patescibacteria group bacterium]|nr:glycerophosphodiester phosphodiesterase [Patescibacteria group bacterium]
MQIIGHRGIHGLAPENTLAGVEHALRVGVDWIEFDVRSTKDGQVVVIHDSHTGRIANERLKISQTNSSHLTKLDTSSGQNIPTLSEFMYAIGKQSKILVELKSRGCAKQVNEIIKTMVKSGYNYDHFMVSSFYPPLLFELYRLNKSIPLALLEYRVSLGLLSFLLNKALPLTGVGLDHQNISRLVVRLAKKRGLFVYTYTVNDPAEAANLKKLGIDAIVTDYPDRMKHVALDTGGASEPK